MSSRRKRRRQRIPSRPPAPERTSHARLTDYRSALSVTRLTYSRKQAAEALGVSITTIDRRVVPAIDTVKTPWGQRLIPVDELERFVDDHLERGQGPRAPRAGGRPPALPETLDEHVPLP